MNPRMKTMTSVPRFSLARTALAATLAATLLGACAPVLIGGAAVGGAMVASDRRTSGAQVDDQGIELKAGQRISQAIGDRGHINVTSFNRQVLLSGEVPSEADKAAVEQAIARVENVKTVVNELTVMPNSSLGTRSNDALITSKLKATYVDSRDLFANAYKVVTERGVVYLMGRVTDREATRGANLARNVGGVQKVVTLFEIISEDELAQVRVVTAPPPAASGPKP